MQNAYQSHASSGSTKWLFVSAFIFGFYLIARSIKIKLTSSRTSSDGNDGLWSSFIIAVGTPPQSVRVLVSTKLSDLWVISKSQSQDDYLDINSPAHRTVGGGLSSPKSTTWQGTIWYEKGQDQNFGKSMAKFEIDDYGSDPTRIGLAGINVDSRTIATVRKGDLNLGLWGINHRSSHLSPPRNGQVSFLESLKASGCIPSLSYAYSAGAWYRKALVLIIDPLRAKLL